MDPPETVDDDVRDVLGELANMVGGNMKSGMSTGVRLSMPSVMKGKDYDVRVCGSEVQERIAFQCDDGNFWVTVLANKE
jgi:chemotaxis protein CheX